MISGESGFLKQIWKLLNQVSVSLVCLCVCVCVGGRAGCLCVWVGQHITRKSVLFMLFFHI